MKFQFLPENFSRSENAPPFETRKIRQFEVERIFLENKKMVQEFVGKSERDTSEPVVSQAAIRHNRSRWSHLFRLPFDSRQNLM